MRGNLVSLVLWLGGVAAAASSSPVGVWRGTVRLADGTTTELVLTLSSEASGALTGSVAVPAQATSALAVTELAASDEEIAFAVPDLPGGPRFTARLAADGSRLTGNMKAEAAPAPATDVYLARVGTDGTIGEVRNATAREGYDSQPAFLPDGAGFLYTSQRAGQTDILRYELAAATSVQMTATPEAEYSPTPMPGGTHFSTVRVEPDGTQRLWRFPLGGGEPELLVPEVAPVGYHAWIDEATLALFVLGDPPTLRLARLGEAGARTLARDIGRCLARVPGGVELSYVDKSDEGSWKVMLAEAGGGPPRLVGATLEGSEDYVWVAPGELLMGQGSTLFLGRAEADGLAWREIADLAAAGVTGISRLALSPDGRWLAMVGETPAPPPATVETPFELVRVEP